MTRDEIGKRVRTALALRLDLPHNPDAEKVLVDMVEEALQAEADRQKVPREHRPHVYPDCGRFPGCCHE